MSLSLKTGYPPAYVNGVPGTMPVVPVRISTGREVISID
jgi:hypothetical protein